MITLIIKLISLLAPACASCAIVREALSGLNVLKTSSIEFTDFFINGVLNFYQNGGGRGIITFLTLSIGCLIFQQRYFFAIWYNTHPFFIAVCSGSLVIITLYLQIEVAYAAGSDLPSTSGSLVPSNSEGRTLPTTIPDEEDRPRFAAVQERGESCYFGRPGSVDEIASVLEFPRAETRANAYAHVFWQFVDFWRETGGHRKPINIDNFIIINKATRDIVEGVNGIPALDNELPRIKEDKNFLVPRFRAILRDLGDF